MRRKTVSVTVDLAGIRIRLRGPAGAVRKAECRYRPYLTERSPGLTLDWETGTPSRSQRWPHPRVESTAEGMVADRRDFQVRWSGNLGRLVTKPEATALDSALRILVSELLADCGGMLVHSAGIGERLFPGRSESGKTTLASMLPRKRVLSDELTAVVPVRGGWELRGTPFWGSFVRGTSTGRARLHGLFFLERRQREEIVPLGAGEAASRLLECVLSFRQDVGRSRCLLSMAANLAKSVPAFRLSYDRAHTGWSRLSRRLEQVLKV